MKKLILLILMLPCIAMAQRYPPSSNGIPTYTNTAALPALATNGAAAITLDTYTLWLFDFGSLTWLAVGSPGAALAVGSPANGLSITTNVLSLALASTSTTGALSSTDWNTFNGKQSTVSFGAFGSTPNANGGGISAGVITLQPADASNPGGVSMSAQTLGAGDKTFAGNILTSTDATYDIGSSGARFGSGYFSTQLLVGKLGAGLGAVTLLPNGSTGGTIRLSYPNVVSWHEIAEDGIHLNIIDSNGYVLAQFSNNASPLYNFNGAANTPIWTLNGTGTVQTGSLGLSGSSSGTVATQVQAAAGTYNFNLPITAGSAGQVLRSQGGGSTAMDWLTPTTGTVTTVSVASANGFAGTVANAASTPAITLSTSITGILQGNGTAISSYPTTGSGNIALASSPSFTTPALGTPSALVGTNITGTGAGFTAGTATNIAGGAGGSIPYQTASATTAMLANGSAGTYLQSQGTTLAPIWSSAPAPVGVAARNFLINGNMDLWQRGTSKTIAYNTAAFVADRWHGFNFTNTGGVITYAQAASTQNGALYDASIKVTTAPGTPDSTYYDYSFYQYADNLTSLTVYNGTLSGSAYIKALGNVTSVQIAALTATGQLSPNGGTILGSAATCTVNSSTYTLCSFQNISVGTTPTTSGIIGLGVFPNGVSSGHFTDLNNGFLVTQAMLNSGATAATFARAGANFGEELAMAQRFYEKSYDVQTFPATATNLGSIAFEEVITSGQFALSFKVSKVVAPTIVIYSPVSGTSGNCYDFGTSGDVSCNTTSGFTSTNGWLAATFGFASQLLSLHYTADAEF